MATHPPNIVRFSQVVRPPVPDADKRFLYPADDHLRPYAAQFTPTLQAELQTRFGPILGQPTHPLADGMALLTWLATTFYPTLPLGVAYRAHGRVGTLRWREESILGRVLTAAMPLMGLTRLVPRLPDQLATVTNFGTIWTARQGSGNWLLGMEDSPVYPEYVAGVLDVLAEVTQTPSMTVAWEAPDAATRIYTIRWATD